MAKRKNSDYMKDAIEIRDKLLNVDNLNVSSSAYLKVVEYYIEEDDGKFAYSLMHRANFMYEHMGR